MPPRNRSGTRTQLAQILEVLAHQVLKGVQELTFFFFLSSPKDSNMLLGHLETARLVQPPPLTGVNVGPERVSV